MQDWVRELAALADDAACREWAAAHPEHRSAEALEQIHAGVIELGLTDRDLAWALASHGLLLAEAAGDPLSRALAQRALGHALYARADCVRALEHYRAALDLLVRHSDEREIARTLNGALQSLIYLGDYRTALEWAERARDIFSRHGDYLRLARLNSNIGNILYRQDRYAGAIAHYEEALPVLRQIGEPRDVASVLINCLVCSISLGRFPQALALYAEARAQAAEHSLPVLVATADYNIAYLHYLRGDYLRAMELYALTRTYCGEVGDSYHAALCDLDEAEMYLELNLTAEGGQLARRAAAGFARLKMDYERGKALVNVAIAESHGPNPALAVRYFRDARKLFAGQPNRVWPALIDLYQALLLLRQGNVSRASRLCARARTILDDAIPGKAALCRLLQAEIALAAGNVDQARAICLEATRRLEESGTAGQRYQAPFVLGQIEEAARRRDAAIAAYQVAQSEIESLRSRLWGENSRISFLKDKLAVYESLFVLFLGGPDTPARNSCAAEEAFLCVERAKSRSMAEMLSVPELIAPSPELQELRRDLNWHYRQAELAGLMSEAAGEPRGPELLRESRRREEELARHFHAVRGVSPELPEDVMSLARMQAALPDHTVLLEYFEARGAIYACLVDGSGIEIRRVCHPAHLQARLRLLRFQISKFRLGPAYLERFSRAWHGATQAHLHALYRLLVEPVRDAINPACRLVVIPHGELHNLPFHALFDGRRHLIDDFAISYAPSAGVFAHCAARSPKPGGRSLVLGVPDPLAPHIDDEARVVAGALPAAVLRMGEQANLQALREHGPASRFLHIATHGLFRRDNPLFSSIRLGDGALSLLDLYQIPLSAELVTLSGCSTGMNAVVAGDELLGLVRGLLYAGAAGALVALWDVNDRSTTEFMQTFYAGLAESADKAVALRNSILRLRETYPHPYHWAPFVLVGKTTIK